MRTQEIIQLHQMARDGRAPIDIARTLHVHRNTVLWHLSHRVEYPLHVIRKLGLRRTLPDSDTMSVYDAAVYLPGWPDRHKIHQLIAAGVIECRMTPQRYWVTTRQAICRAARMMLDDGLYYRSDRLKNYTPDHADIVRRTSHLGHHLHYWPARQWCYLPAHSVQTAAAQIDAEIIVPDVITHRAIATLDLCGVATV